MTEPQKVQRERPASDTSNSTGPRLHEDHTVEVRGRTWRLIGRDDGRSWDLSEGHHSRSAVESHVASFDLTERGYFSTDASGTVRGPYSTLGEATYPFEYGDRLLLDDPAILRTNPPRPDTATPPTTHGRHGPSRSAAVLTIAVALGLLVVVLRTGPFSVAHR